MWPSHYAPELRHSTLYRKLELLAQSVLGEDMSFDFDMMISKPPGSDVETPWHQDESYWLDMSDKRAISFWVALQDVNVNNGCMWFVSGSHLKPLRRHWKVKDGHHINQCECSEDEGRPEPLPAGGCTGHHGRTLHYTRGNKSNSCRRALIVNFRPTSMIQYERDHQYDHGLSGLENIIQQVE
ncbi:hypothetical protein EB796_009457 [Bugula neritina]|uniref:Phytanoyl-CoA dioxygenase n=1 Tax=Bugula neritina TaxID=10212 RepID=A0A7J7K3S2_BUGNE|nr:hypothetical protein EB796_009457 [Bugula neritina]